jgi:hypothetical protein
MFRSCQMLRWINLATVTSAVKTAVSRVVPGNLLPAFKRSSPP